MHYNFIQHIPFHSFRSDVKKRITSSLHSFHGMWKGFYETRLEFFNDFFFKKQLPHKTKVPEV